MKFGFPRFPWRDGLKWVSIRKSEGITAHERFSIACTKWLYLPYVVCRRKGAATAAARLSFLSPSLHGYPNFTPESQYLLITLEGIVLYSPLSLSLSPSPASFPLLLSLQHDLCTFFCGQPFSPLFFFSPPPTFHPIFQEKEKHAQDGFSLPSRCQVDARSCSSRYFLYSRLEGRVERGGEGGRRRFEEHSRHDENSPHDSFILGNECLPRSGGNVPFTLEIRRNPRGWTERHLCASPRINLRILPAKLSNPSTFFYFRIANNLFRGHCFL